MWVPHFLSQLPLLTEMDSSDDCGLLTGTNGCDEYGMTPTLCKVQNPEVGGKDMMTSIPSISEGDGTFCKMVPAYTLFSLTYIYPSIWA